MRELIIPSDIVRSMLSGRDCIVCFETAADCLGLSNATSQRRAIHVYALKDLEIEGVDCTIVDSFADIDVEVLDGISYTSRRQTIFDLLRYDRDDQVIVESLADWYFSHGESYEGLDVPADLQSIFDDYKQDAIDYYRY